MRFDGAMALPEIDLIKHVAKRQTQLKRKESLRVNYPISTNFHFMKCTKTSPPTVYIWGLSARLHATCSEYKSKLGK